MVIRFSCPECGQLVEVGDGAAGMQVRCGSCQRAVRAPHDPPPRRAGPADLPPPQVRASGRPGPDVQPAGGGRWLPTPLSIAALLLALIALLVACFRDPLGSGMSRYDFSTPRAAVQSEAKIAANGDVRAVLEREGVGGKKAKEKARTLEVS